MPSVVLIVVDALRADHLGLAGAGVDRLMREGARFTNAISQSSWTKPSVTSLLTGLYPGQHRMVDVPLTGDRSAAALDPAVPTLPEHLRRCGCETAVFAGANANLRPAFGLTRGFSDVRWLPTTDGGLVVAEFADWLRSVRSGPFFAYLHLMDVHHPLPDEIVPSRLDTGWTGDGSGAELSELAGHYARAVGRVGAHVERVLDALERAGAFDETLVALTADHGEELGEHGATLAHGRTLHGELVRVPLVVRAPGLARAGATIDVPVQLVDLLPTFVAAVGGSPPDLVGRSLVDLLRDGTGPDGALAFSELQRHDRYVQAVTSRAHRLIATHVFAEREVGRPSDLRPGTPVTIHGQAIRGGGLLATKVSVGTSGGAKVRGTVDRVDPATGDIDVLGVTFGVTRSTERSALDERTPSVADLRVGDRISAHLAEGAAGRLIATSLHQRNAGGKAKVAGIVDRVRDAGDQGCIVTVLGTEVLVPPGARVTQRHTRSPGDDGDPVSRVLAGDYLRRDVALYDVVADPGETRDISAERLDVVQELETALAGFTEALRSGQQGTAASVELDPETLDQLRLMGYVD
jgi:hypothetical protein